MTEFPVVQDNKVSFPDYDKTRVCPQCGERDVFYKNEHVKIHGGALLLGELKNGAQPAKLVDELQAFLFMDWESGNDSEVYAELEIAKDVKKGQFHMVFCTTDCLRLFSNKCVDTLESKIGLAKNA